MIRSRAAVVTESMDGERFDVAAAQLMPELSRKKIKAIIDAGGAYVNKRRIRFAKHGVHHGDRLEVFWDEPPAHAVEGAGQVEGPRMKFISAAPRVSLSQSDIIFEGRDFLVVNKPAGIASQATLTSSTDTLSHFVHKLDPRRYPLTHLLMVHRLDKDTSGLMLLARNKDAQKHFEDLFKERKVEKVYEALCFHVPPQPEGVLTHGLVKDAGRDNTYHPVRPGAKGAHVKSAETHYRTVEAFPAADAAYVECVPKTGRTHQIRVHMLALGCPLLGDKTYARNVIGHPFAQSALRHMLHARRIRFAGPDGAPYDFEAPLPADFRECLRLLQVAKV